MEYYTISGNYHQLKILPVYADINKMTSAYVEKSYQTKWKIKRCIFLVIKMNFNEIFSFFLTTNFPRINRSNYMQS